MPEPNLPGLDRVRRNPQKTDQPGGYSDFSCREHWYLERETESWSIQECALNVRMAIIQACFQQGAGLCGQVLERIDYQFGLIPFRSVRTPLKWYF
jgi:hypothetical protein